MIEYQAPVVPTTQPPTTQPPTTQPTTQPPTTQPPTTVPVEPVELDLNGSGTSDAPYLIQSTEDWNKLAAYISNGGNTNDKHFKLTKNITVTAMLGEDDTDFSGSFDGDGHTLTLGSTRVTNKNMRNILGDGKASYDPKTHTLTLDEPSISGDHSENRVTSTIYSADDLTIKGSCHTTLRNEYGVECRGNLTLDGDISIPAIESSYKGYQNITVLSGEVTADSEHNGISADGSLTVADGATLEINMKDGSVSAKKITLGEKIGIAVPEGGYISTTKTGQTILDADGNAAHEIYIREKTPTVSFEMNGHGAAVEAQVLDYGEKASEPKAPTAEGCDFGGWFTDKECTKAYDFNTSVTDDITLYAKWTLKKYTIKFVNYDGTELQSSEVDYDTMPEYKGMTPVKKPDLQNSYEFNGWTPKITKVTGEATYKATYKSIARKLPIGDVNGDGKVTIDDVTQLQKHLAELVQLTPDQIIAADTNCDGIVNIDDATNIQKYLAELIDHLG